MHFYPAHSLMGFHNVALRDGYLHYERKDAHDLHLADDFLLQPPRQLGTDRTTDYNGCRLRLR